MPPRDVDLYLKNKRWVLAWLDFHFFVRRDSGTRGDYWKSKQAAKEMWRLDRERAAAIAGTAAHDAYNKGRARLKGYKALKPAIELDPFAYWPPELPSADAWERAVQTSPWLLEFDD
jgi:hypothetical protein